MVVSSRLYMNQSSLRSASSVGVMVISPLNVDRSSKENMPCVVCKDPKHDFSECPMRKYVGVNKHNNHKYCQVCSKGGRSSVEVRVCPEGQRVLSSLQEMTGYNYVC